MCTNSNIKFFSNIIIPITRKPTFSQAIKNSYQYFICIYCVAYRHLVKKVLLTAKKTESLFVPDTRTLIYAL
jgi:hypothetical protein